MSSLIQLTPMKQTEESAMKQSKNQLHEINKPKMPTAQRGSRSHRATVPLILQQLHYHLHVTSVILHLLIDICHCLITNDD